MEHHNKRKQEQAELSTTLDIEAGISAGWEDIHFLHQCLPEVDRDEIDDDQTGQIRIRTREIADRAAIHKDTEIARLLVNGASAGYHSYDGVPFFGSTHESGKSGHQPNGVQLRNVRLALEIAELCPLRVHIGVNVLFGYLP